MLYQVMMFWDRTFSRQLSADAKTENGTHWVEVAAKGSAKTTIFVDSKASAEKLARTINEIVGSAKLSNEIPGCVWEHAVEERLS